MVSPYSKGVPALLLAGSILAALGWMTEAKTVEAQPPSLFDDADGDFLPDALEWALMTDPQVADTDEDGVDDFIEVVQNGFPLENDAPRPKDHEMRVLATTRVDNAGESQFWLHLLFRSMSGLEAPLEGFVPWIDVGGVKYPIHGLLAGAPLHSRVLHRDDEGTLVLVSLLVATERAARSLLPFSFGVSAKLGGRPITSSTYYMDVEGTTSNLTALIVSCPEISALHTRCMPSITRPSEERIIGKLRFASSISLA